MTNTRQVFDVAIIGGGIMGSAAAYFLAHTSSPPSIVVIEPDPTYTLATTPQGAGGVRQLFSVKENIQMSQMSLAFYKAFDQTMKFDDYQPNIQFKKQGYLFTVENTGVATLRRNHGLQTSLGVNVDLLDQVELAARFPSIGLKNVALACYSGDDGWIDPTAALQGFRKHAVYRGVTYLKSRVVGFDTSQRKITAAKLANGESLYAKMFINTAGPWASDIADMIDAQLPVDPYCRVQHFWLCAEQIEPLPLVKDETGMFFRPEGAGFAGGCPSFEIPPGFVEDINSGYFADYFERSVWPLLAARVPCFEKIKLQRSWAGHYAQNRVDGNMIIGKFSRQYNNILTACGFSGHGIMHAPAVGRALSELTLHGRFETLDLNPLGMNRVWDNKPYPEVGIR